LARLGDVHLLVVDDIGAEAQTAWGSGLLGELLNARHQDLKRTIITSNLTREAFKERVGERVADRVREDGEVVDLPFPSMRGKRASNG
jgi:DNA replication protein DnaC